MSMDENQLELENRIKNLLWTVSGDYTLDMKPDVEAFLRAKEIALYDGVKHLPSITIKRHWGSIW